MSASSPSMQIVAGIALVGAGQDLDQRRLAGAVVAEQRHHLAGIEIDRRVVDRACTPPKAIEMSRISTSGVPGMSLISHRAIPHFTRARR